MLSTYLRECHEDATRKLLLWNFSLMAGNRHGRACTVKNIRIPTDILWRVFHILTERVPCTTVSVNRRNNEARARDSPQNIRGYTDVFDSVHGALWVAARPTRNFCFERPQCSWFCAANNPPVFSLYTVCLRDR